MNKFSMLCFGGALAIASVVNAPSSQAQSAPRLAPGPKAFCAPTGEAWMKNAFDYLNSKPASGKRPAVFATISLVSLEPGTALGKAPDRTNSWYAHGEVTRNNFPNTWVFEGKFPLWINNGSDSKPFSGDTSTLGITIRGDGQATLHYQVDGRNRMGKGPQPLNLGAVASGSSDSTLMFSAATDFFGKKFIVLSLTKGEGDGPVTPVVAPKPIGARYRISPSFIVTNADDGPGDNTLELQTNIDFFQGGKQVAFFVHRRSLGKGQRMENEPFEVVVLDGDVKTANLVVKGSAYDVDQLSSNDDVWKQSMAFSIAAVANKKKDKGLITITSNFIPDDAAGNLDILVQKIADVY